MRAADADRVDVSVLVPVLNEEEHIRAAADAMLAQRFDGRIEFLFVDGGSDDATPALLRELAESDPRVRVLDNPRRVTPVALNIGLRTARGEFIARMDAHTEYPPDYIALGVERLRAGGAAHVSGPQIAVGSGTWSRRIALALSTRLGTGGADFRHLSGDEIEVDSGFTGSGRGPRSSAWRLGRGLDQRSGQRAGRAHPQRGRADGLPAGDGRDYVPRDRSPAWRASTGATASTGPRPRAATPRACAAPTCSPPGSCSPLPSRSCSPGRCGGSRWPGSRSTRPRWRR